MCVLYHYKERIKSIDYTAEIPVRGFRFCFQNLKLSTICFTQIAGVFLYLLERVKEVEKIIYLWEIYSDEDISVYRYCHNCGSKVKFTDSGVRRHNANGKDIFEYAIYKCERGHSWNKLLEILKPTNEIRKFADRKVSQGCCLEIININNHKANKVKVIEIHIKEIDSKVRLDKILSKQIIDFSRNQIVSMINLGSILVNGQRVKPGFIIKKGDLIAIEL